MPLRATLFFLALLLAGPLHAQDRSRAEIAALRMDIAARQQFLSERIVASACFLRLGIDAETQVRVMAESLDQFRVSLDHLERGNPALGLPGLRDGMAVATLYDTRAIWTRFEQAAREIETSPERLDDLIGLEPRLSAAAGSVVTSLGASLADPDPERTRRIRQAGQQRALGQSLVKEACLQQLSQAADAPARIERLSQDLDAGSLAMIASDAREMVFSSDTPESNAHLAAHYALSDLRFTLAPLFEGHALAPLDLYDVSQGFEAFLGNIETIIWDYRST